MQYNLNLARNFCESVKEPAEELGLNVFVTEFLPVFFQSLLLLL